MSPSIRPLPIEAASQRTENDAVTSTESSTENSEEFAIFLGTPPSSTDERKPEDPWSILGVGTPLVPVPQLLFPFSGSEHHDPPLAREKSAEEGSEATAAPSSPRETNPELVERLKVKGDVPEQKLPGAPPPRREETAVKIAQTPEKDAGTLVAKEPSMLLMMENSADLSSFEQHPSFALREITAKNRLAEPKMVPIELLDLTAATPLRPQASQKSLPVQVESVREPRSVAIVESIREQVQLVKSSHRRELTVILRPDANTEIFVEIRQEGGRIQLQARCDRGDFQWLNSQWSTIQKALANQGIRVEALQAPSNVRTDVPVQAMAKGVMLPTARPQVTVPEPEQVERNKRKRGAGHGSSDNWQGWA